MVSQTKEYFFLGGSDDGAQGHKGVQLPGGMWQHAMLLVHVAIDKHCIAELAQCKIVFFQS